MEFWRSPRALTVLAVALLAGFVLYQLWVWEVERVEVSPGNFLVRIHLWGKDLPEGEIIAPDDSYKGVQAETLNEGRHFLNPLLWTYEMHKMVEVPIGKCLVLTRKYGTRIPPERVAAGDILAGPGERGIVREPLQPGRHRLNPHAYEWQMVEAVEIKAGEVGVRTLKVGLDPRTLPLNRQRSPYTVPTGYRGVQEKPVSNGTYYINPFVESIVGVQTRAHRVEFAEISFPSKDGFALRPHVLVTYAVLPEKAPELLVYLTNLGHLNQEDATPKDQAENQVLQKVVLPLIRGYVRIEGSKYNARDFISAGKPVPGAVDMTNPRERLQKELMAKVAPSCHDVGIDIESITLGEIGKAEDLAEGADKELAQLARQIADREIARVQRDKNEDLIGQYKAEQTRKAAESLEEQSTRKVEAETKLKVAKTRAEQDKEVAKLELDNDLKAARERLEAARSEAQATLSRARAEADVIARQNEAEVSGLRTAVRAFASADAYAQYQVLTRLAPALTEIFASDSSDFAKLFASYMTPPSGKTAPPQVPAGLTMPPAGPPVGARK